MIVFDASTLILIAKVELLDAFLAHATLPVAVPSEVRRECRGSPRTLDALLILRALEEARIGARVVKDRRLVAKLRADFSLGKGEAKAIALAIGERAALVAIDDKNGINACKLLGLAFTTAVGILVGSRERGWVGEAEALEKLALLASYGRYKDSILDDAKRRLEAKP